MYVYPCVRRREVASFASFAPSFAPSFASFASSVVRDDANRRAFGPLASFLSANSRNHRPTVAGDERTHATRAGGRFLSRAIRLLSRTSSSFARCVRSRTRTIAHARSVVPLALDVARARSR